MRQNCKNWVVRLLAGVLALLALCAALNYAVDPCFHYRLPSRLQPVFLDERCQNAGLARHIHPDTLLLGTSMVANFRASDVSKVFGGSALKLSYPDGYLSEFDEALQLVFCRSTPKRVIFGLDMNILLREETRNSLPHYLYNETPLDDIRYLLDKNSLYYSLYTILSNARGTAQTMDEAFCWDDTLWWSKTTALANYERPPISGKALGKDAFEENCRSNLQMLERWLQAQPETEFDIFFPPYSILYWDKETRLGRSEAIFGMLETAFDTLLPYENVTLHFFPAQTELIADLNNYGDYIHHSGAVCQTLLTEMAEGTRRVTAENRKKILADLHEFVIDYDYESIWATP